MTAKELFPKYVEIFELVIEQAGEDTGNKVYKNISKVILDNKDKIESSIENDVPFSLFVTVLIMIVLLEVHTPEKLDKMSKEDTKVLMDDLFDRYLKKPTRKFTASYGLPTMNCLEYGAFIRLRDNDRF